MSTDNVSRVALPRIALSWSGGKDCAWALQLIREQGVFEVAALVTTVNSRFARIAIHGVREELLQAQAAAVGLPLWQVPLPWPCSNADYEARMQEVCSRATAAGLTGLAFGDLFLEDIRAYRERLLALSGLAPIFPVWGLPTHELAREMLTRGLRAKVACVDLKWLDAGFAGREFDAATLDELPEKVDPCGERGEFHTFVYDGPMFNHAVLCRYDHTVERDGYAYADLLPRGSEAQEKSAVA